MCNLAVGVTVTVVGVALVVVTSSIGYALVPNIVKNLIKSEVQLVNNTEQWDRFQEVPFGINFNVKIFNISNPEEVLAGGVPVLNEIGPFVYKSYQTRHIEGVEDDKVFYRMKEYLEFDPESSYPLTLDENVTIVNVAYHGVLQMAEQRFPGLMGAMNLALGGIFGVHTGPIMTVRVGDLLFDGIDICKTPGLFGGIACTQIRALATNVRNMRQQEDGSLEFSILKYKHDQLSEVLVANRGLNDASNLGSIYTVNGSSVLNNWNNEDTNEGERNNSICNMINGTDAGIFAPFVDRDKTVYALNLDICRSVDLRYEEDTSYEGIPAVRFSANEWFLDNHQACFCLNVTRGITRDDGCLHHGVMELYSCVGAFLVLSYPHFLYADFRYRNGVIGMHPVADDHRIFVDLEPNTGTVVRGMKRAQFNIFMRPITSIPGTQSLRTTLTPILWVEEGMELPENYVDMLKTRLLQRLRLVHILIPVLVAVTCLVASIGIAILIRVKICRDN